MSTVEAHPFEPLVDKSSEVLILGTFPSIESFKNNFYYAHPRNQFWKIMAQLFDTDLSSDSEKVEFCHHYHIALWDVYAFASRSSDNSSDTNLKQTQVNDLSLFLKQYPSIRHIFFTSQSAHKAYMKYYASLKIEVSVLPSPSPANARLSFTEKVRIYKKDFFHTITNPRFT